jgi:hypothetical protein
VSDTFLQTITIVDNSNDGYTGTVAQFFSYAIVPEPGTALLVGGGLFAFDLISRRAHR